GPETGPPSPPRSGPGMNPGPPLVLERAGGVARVTLDRPPLNLLEPDLIRGLRDTFRALAADPSVRIAVLSGRGRAFTAGMDVHVGVPSVIEAALLAPTIGPGRAAELLLCGEAIGADDAFAWGLVNRVVAPDELPAAVDAIVAKILAGAPAAIRLQKELMIRW